MGGSSEIFQGDIADKREARRLVQNVRDTYERIDILVNNAGITRDRSIRKMTDEDWTDVIDTNLNSAFYCTSAAVPAMIEQNFGRIVSVASFVGQAGKLSVRQTMRPARAVSLHSPKSWHWNWHDTTSPRMSSRRALRQLTC